MKNLLKKKCMIAIVIDACMLVAGFLLKPATDFMLTKLSKCTFYEMGILCPSCGGTRCVSNFVSGNFSASWHYHPFFFCVCIYIILGIICMNLGYIFRIALFEKLFRKMLSPAAIITLVIIFVIFGMSRFALSYFGGIVFI